MNRPASNSIREEVYRLTIGALGGEISDADARLLERYVATNAEARRAYHELICDACNLRTWADRATAVTGGSSGSPISPPLDATAGESSPAQPPASTLFGFLGGTMPWGENLSGITLFGWAILGFVAMLVGLPTIMAIVSVLGITNRPAAQLIAADCRWTGAGISTGSNLRPGQKIDLAAGKVKIAFARGAVVTMYGPGVLEVVSESSVRLLVGKLTALAETKTSRGFAVRTTAMTLVDRGTEFGVLVPRDGIEEVHVFRGQVQAELAAGSWSGAMGASKTADSVSSDTQSVHPSTYILTSDHALRVDTNRRNVVLQAAVWEQFGLVAPPMEPLPLFGSGVGLDPGQSDPHWSITKVSDEPSFTPRPAVAALFSDQSPVGSRQAGQWISLTKDPGAPAGRRLTFRTKFDLTGFDPATAKIDGRFVADDWITEVRLNGQTLPLSNRVVNQWKAFHIGEGFVAGNNTVEMVVENNPALGPTAMGMCVQWKGEARRKTDK
jgi:hypothetical protein